MQGWYRDGLVNPNITDSFIRGQTVISWVGPLGVRPLPPGVPARPADRAAAALRAAAQQRDGIVAVGHHRQRDGRGRRLEVPVLSAAARPGGPDDAGQRLDPGDAERDPPVAELQAGRPRAPLCAATRRTASPGHARRLRLTRPSASPSPRRSSGLATARMSGRRWTPPWAQIDANLAKNRYYVPTEP